MGDALSKSPMSLGGPDRHRAGRSREGRTLPDSQCESRGEQGGKAANKARGDGGRAHDQATDPEHSTRTESVTEPATHQLKERIRIREGGKGKTESVVVGV